jgi:hypothetical protein
MAREGIIKGPDGRFTAGSCLGTVLPASKATLHPTNLEIAWAAGIYEGEGSCQLSKGTTHASVSQKDLWLPQKLRDLFGGSVRQRDPHASKSRIDGKEYPRLCGEWYITGARARGFLMTMYKFLSPRRQDQARLALGLIN